MLWKEVVQTTSDVVCISCMNQTFSHSILSLPFIFRLFTQLNIITCMTSMRSECHTIGCCCWCRFFIYFQMKLSQSLFYLFHVSFGSNEFVSKLASVLMYKHVFQHSNKWRGIINNAPNWMGWLPVLVVSHPVIQFYWIVFTYSLELNDMIDLLPFSDSK